ncbi:MAG: hypothetical protein Q8K63_08190, partial [Acidimicrobiales bacterium]|nr:hypothetical protein [Acidimicrobiales bacterium]
MTHSRPLALTHSIDSVRPMLASGAVVMGIATVVATIGLAVMTLWSTARSTPASSGAVVFTLPPAPPETEAAGCDTAPGGPESPDGPANSCSGAQPPGSDLTESRSGGGNTCIPVDGTDGGLTVIAAAATPEPSGLSRCSEQVAAPGITAAAKQNTAMMAPEGPRGSAEEIGVRALVHVLGKSLGIFDTSHGEMQWGEIDATYSAVVIGRRYFSRLGEEEVRGSIGDRWFHDFNERIERMSPPEGSGLVAPDRIIHRSWNQPHVDPKYAYVDDGTGGYDGPVQFGSKIETATPAEAVQWPGAAYKLTFRDLRKHFFGADGRIVARVGPSGHDAVTFQYGGISGALSSVTDPSGQVFTVGSDPTGAFMTSITDPSGATIVYEVDTQTRLLDAVVLPARGVHSNGYDNSGNPVASPWSASTTRTTERAYTYNAQNRLNSVVKDSLSLELSASYESDDPSNLAPDAGRLWQAVDASGGSWTFDTGLTTRTITDPRGFQTEYLVDAESNVVRIREFIASTDPNVPSRASSGYRDSLITRNASCQCGLIDSMVEPDGTGYQLTYDSDYNVLEIARTPNDSSADRLRWSWTYDSQGRMATYVPPEANASASPTGLTYTYAYITLPANHPVAPDGIEVQTSNPANGVHAGPVVWTHRYDTRHRLVEFEAPPIEGGLAGDYVRAEYYPAANGGASHRLKRWYTTRDLSVWSEYGYDANGRLVTATTNTQQTFTQSYNAAGQLVGWTAPSRGSQQYGIERQYDGDRRLSVSRYRYYDRGPSPTGTDPYTWVEVSYWYDAAGKALFIERDVDSGIRARESFGYDASGNLSDYVDADGRRQHTLSDERGLEWELYDGYQSPDEVMSTIDYTPAGEFLTRTAPLDTRFVVTRASYDKFGRLASFEVDGANRVSLQYDAANRATFMDTYGRDNGTLALLEREEMEYADWHRGATRRTHRVYGGNGGAQVRSNVTEIEYTPSGRPVTLELDGVVQARFTYYPWGDPKNVYDDLGSAEEIIRDPLTRYVVGHKLTQIDPVHGAPQIIERQFERDQAGRATRQLYVAPNEPTLIETYEYDSFDNVVRYADAKGVVRKTEFGLDGRVKVVRNGYDSGTGLAASVESYGYTLAGLMQTATDNRQNTVTWLYDNLGRAYREIQADATFWEWRRNLGGFVENVTSPTGKRFEFEYDLRGLVSRRTVRASTGGPVLRTDDYQWAMSGDLLSATKVEGGVTSSATFTRDGDGTVSSETADNWLVQYTRDSLGRVTQLVGPASHAKYTYDHYNRVASIKDAALVDVAKLWYYGPGAALSRVSRGDRTRTDYTRDGYGRLVTAFTRRGTTRQLQYDYTWDVDGTLLAETRTHDGVGDVYGYDALKRLTRFVRASVDPAAELALPGSTAHDTTVAYGLDPDHHRTQVSSTPYQGTPSVVPYVTDPSRHHYNSVGGVTRTTNLDGDVTAIGNRTFVYDALDNLREVRDSGVLVASYSYDALDRRSSKWTGGTTTLFVNAGP